MARTYTEIYDRLIAEKETQSTLSGLNPATGENAAALIAELTSGSKVAIWRLVFFVVAVGHWIHENIFDLHKAEVLAIAPTLITGVPLWYQRESFLFQYGDPLIWNGKAWVYAVVDETKQIVKRCSVVEIQDGTRLLKIKVAKLDGSGQPIPLDPAEMAAFDYYWLVKKFAGTNYDGISQDPDLLKLMLKIQYDPLVLKATGESILNAGVFPVEDAINAFIQNLNANNFNGNLFLDELVRVVRAVAGVLHAEVDSAEGAETLQGYLPVDPLTGYNPIAGYMNIDPAFPLSSTVTYISA